MHTLRYTLIISNMFTSSGLYNTDTLFYRYTLTRHKTSHHNLFFMRLISECEGAGRKRDREGRVKMDSEEKEREREGTKIQRGRNVSHPWALGRNATNFFTTRMMYV